MGPPRVRESGTTEYTERSRRRQPPFQSLGRAVQSIRGSPSHCRTSSCLSELMNGYPPLTPQVSYSRTPLRSRRAHIITTGSHRGAQLGGPGRSWFHTHHFLFRRASHCKVISDIPCSWSILRAHPRYPLRHPCGTRKYVLLLPYLPLSCIFSLLRWIRASSSQLVSWWLTWLLSLFDICFNLLRYGLHHAHLSHASIVIRPPTLRPSFSVSISTFRRPDSVGSWTSRHRH